MAPWRDRDVIDEDKILPPDKRRRVRCKVSGNLGAVVAGPWKGNRWQVDWDDPTPYQGVARADIPGKFFEWADTDQIAGQVDG